MPSSTPQRRSDRLKGLRSTQRERLITGAIEAANHDGYSGASITTITSAAAVSRPTFYEYFTDKDDCLLGAIQAAQAHLVKVVQDAIDTAPPGQALDAAVRAIVSFAESDPATARFLTSETMAGGPRALDARDQGLKELATVIEKAEPAGAKESISADFSTPLLLGGIYRLLASRLRRGGHLPIGLADELASWLSSYTMPYPDQQWKAFKPLALRSAPRRAPEYPLRAVPPLPPGRPRVSPDEVARNHRQRILLAAASLAESKGYAATTIGDITALAGLNARSFYAAFSSKQDAFMALHELGSQHVMAVTSGAFFSASSWPERSWDAGLAFNALLEHDPMLAHIGFVEAYAVGPGAVQRVEDSHTTFTLFLQEGFQHATTPQPPSQLQLEAVITTIFEIVYRQCRKPGRPKLTGLLPHMTFLWLAPFLGARGANEFIERQLNDGSQRSSEAPIP